ncbi:hypothetical protein LA76x_2460 [Lysobacter antibioticus]|uniref:Uncharacterized protein n=1 Tax=Lysobacter antibioticus TaxID=84531 RepID=A0A0S2FAW3_LYSAN|nr:hypothetical protein LA76x_2460 [Lysobacter antibioticus]
MPVVAGLSSRFAGRLSDSNQRLKQLPQCVETRSASTCRGEIRVAMQHRAAHRVETLR